MSNKFKERKQRIESIKTELQRKRNEIENLEKNLQREMIFFKTGDVLEFFGSGIPDLKIIKNRKNSISAINVRTGEIEYNFKEVLDPSRITCNEMDSLLMTNGRAWPLVDDIHKINGKDFPLKNRIPDNIEQYIRENSERVFPSLEENWDELLVEVEDDEDEFEDVKVP